MAKQIPQGERDLGKIVATVRQLASEGEGFLEAANNLSDVASAATSFDNIKQTATETYAGVGEIADSDEADAGTETGAKFLNPEKGVILLNANMPPIAADLTAIYTRLAAIEAALLDSGNPFLEVGNGWVETFDDSNDIDTGASSNQVVSGGYARPNVSGGSNLAGTTILGTIGTSSVLRDGTTSVAAASCVRKTAKLNVPLYVGYTLTTESILSSGILYGSNDQGLFQGANPTFDIVMRASTTAEGAPTTSNIATHGRQVGSLLSQTDTMNESAGRTVPIDNAWAATTFKHVWFGLIMRSGASVNACFAEVRALDPLTKPNMTLVGDTLVSAGAITEMAAAIFVKLREPVTVNTDYLLDLSTNGGTNWTTMTLVDQSSAPLPGESPGDWRQYTVDFSAVTNAGVTPKWRVRTANNKDIETHQLRIMWQ